MGVAQTTRRRRFARSSSPCFIGSFLIHDVVRRDCHSGIAPRGFVSMRDRQHRIARPRPATIMTYRSACGCRSNRAHPFSEERSRAQSAISPDRTTVVRPWLWRVGFAGSHPAAPASFAGRSLPATPLRSGPLLQVDIPCSVIPRQNPVHRHSGQPRGFYLAPLPRSINVAPATPGVCRRSSR